jgi:threonine synthase
MMKYARKNNPVGQTPLIEQPELSHLFTVQNLFIKDESANTTGTVKDRRNSFILEEAERLKVDKLVLITSGNNGLSLSTLAQRYDIKVVCIVDRNLDQDIIRTLKAVAYQVIEVNLQHKILRPEEIISFAREREDEVIWDVTNGYEESYTTIVNELRAIKPNYIVVPVGSGEIFVGLAQGLDRLKMNTRLIGMGVQNTLSSFADKLHTPWTPYTRALHALEQRGHRVIRITEEEIKSTYTKYRHVISCEPSSAVVFSVFQHIQFQPHDTVVLINTGRAKHAK